MRDWEFHEKRGRVAIRKGIWKGVRYDISVDELRRLNNLNDNIISIGQVLNIRVSQ